jgi:pimeloyl-ACP methyl ester carboxylesterase
MPQDVEEYARITAELASSLESDVVVGFSMGATVAYEMLVSGAFGGPVVLLGVSLSAADEPGFFRAIIRLGSIDDNPARRLCEAGTPAWVMHAEKGDGGLTQHERAVLEACPGVQVVTVPGHVFFLPNDVPERIADLIVQALGEA